MATSVQQTSRYTKLPNWLTFTILLWQCQKSTTHKLASEDLCFPVCFSCFMCLLLLIGTNQCIFLTLPRTLLSFLELRAKNADSVDAKFQDSTDLIPGLMSTNRSQLKRTLAVMSTLCTARLHQALEIRQRIGRNFEMWEGCGLLCFAYLQYRIASVHVHHCVISDRLRPRASKFSRFIYLFKSRNIRLDE